MRPDLSRVPAFYHNYIAQAPEDDLVTALKNETRSMIDFFESLPVEKRNYRYAEGKWTIQEVLQHIIDAERVFTYRALRFARKDTTPVPGFDENIFAENAKADRRSWNDLMDELKAVRKSSEIFFRSLDDEQLAAEGLANNKSISVIGLGFIVAGHAAHHVNVIRERYL